VGNLMEETTTTRICKRRRFATPLQSAHISWVSFTANLLARPFMGSHCASRAQLFPSGRGKKGHLIRVQPRS
jgi:hypothetical protein